MLTKNMCYIKDGSIIREVTSEVKALVETKRVKEPTLSVEWLIEKAQAYLNGNVGYEYLFKTQPYATIVYGGPDCMEEVVYSEEGLRNAISTAPTWSKPQVLYHTNRDD